MKSPIETVLAKRKEKEESYHPREVSRDEVMDLFPPHTAENLLPANQSPAVHQQNLHMEQANELVRMNLVFNAKYKHHQASPEPLHSLDRRYVLKVIVSGCIKNFRHIP